MSKRVMFMCKYSVIRPMPFVIRYIASTNVHTTFLTPVGHILRKGSMDVFAVCDEIRTHR